MMVDTAVAMVVLSDSISDVIFIRTLAFVHLWLVLFCPLGFTFAHFTWLKCYF